MSSLSSPMISSNGPLMHLPKSLTYFCFLLPLTACSSRLPSTLEITNGILDVGDPGVILIQGISSNDLGPSRCTASLIKPQILLTAAHCLRHSDADEIREITTVSSRPKRMIDHRIHPLWHNQLRFDVALIKLNEKDISPQPLSLSSTLPQEGEWVRLVGFGANDPGESPDDYKGQGVKRTGKVQVYQLNDHFIFSKGMRTAYDPATSKPSGLNVALGHGDSGGPMLNQKGEIVGIATMADTKRLSRQEILSVISAHTQIKAVSDFLEKSLAELEKSP